MFTRQLDFLEVSLLTGLILWVFIFWLILLALLAFVFGIFALATFLSHRDILEAYFFSRIRLQDFLRCLPSLHKPSLPVPDRFLTCFVALNLIENFLEFCPVDISCVLLVGENVSRQGSSKLSRLLDHRFKSFLDPSLQKVSPAVVLLVAHRNMKRMLMLRIISCLRRLSLSVVDNASWHV